MRKEKIIQILPFMSDKSDDGATYTVVSLCKALIRDGFNVVLLNGECSYLSVQPDFLLRFPLSPGPVRLCRTPQMLQWLNRMGKAKQISVIHTHGMWTMPNVYPEVIRRKYHVPTIMSPHGSMSAFAMQSGSVAKKLFWPLYQHRMLKRVSCFHATSESEYTDIRRLGFKQPVAIIPNGIDYPVAIVADKPAGLRTLLFLGRIAPIKGLDMLLPAWNEVAHKFPQWRLRIIGPDSRGYLAKVQKMATDLALERIEFSGSLSGDAKWAAYREAELFILPSYSENFGNTVAEALGIGIPVIASTGTPWQILEEKGCGWWVPANVAGISQVLEQAMSLAPPVLSAMGENGTKWARDTFSWKKVAQMMADTYSWAINHDRRPDFIRLD